MGRRTGLERTGDLASRCNDQAPVQGQGRPGARAASASAGAATALGHLAGRARALEGAAVQQAQRRTAALHPPCAHQVVVLGAAVENHRQAARQARQVALNDCALDGDGGGGHGGGDFGQAGARRSLGCTWAICMGACWPREAAEASGGPICQLPPAGAKQAAGGSRGPTATWQTRPCWASTGRSGRGSNPGARPPLPAEGPAPQGARARAPGCQTSEIGGTPARCHRQGLIARISARTHVGYAFGHLHLSSRFLLPERPVDVLSNGPAALLKGR